MTNPTHEHGSDRELLIHIARKVDDMSAGLEALQAEVTDLTTEDEALTTAVTETVANLASIEEALETLKNAGTTTDAELEPLTTAITAAVASTTAAVEKLKA